MTNRHLALPITFALALGAADPSAPRLLDASTSELMRSGSLQELLSHASDQSPALQSEAAPPDRLAQSCFNGVWRRC
jgi:hypothetical protein